MKIIILSAIQKLMFKRNKAYEEEDSKETL